MKHSAAFCQHCVLSTEQINGEKCRKPYEGGIHSPSLYVRVLTAYIGLIFCFSRFLQYILPKNGGRGMNPRKIEKY